MLFNTAMLHATAILLVTWRWNDIDPRREQLSLSLEEKGFQLLPGLSITASTLPRDDNSGLTTGRRYRLFIVWKPSVNDRPLRSPCCTPFRCCGGMVSNLFSVSALGNLATKKVLSLWIRKFMEHRLWTLYDCEKITMKRTQSFQGRLNTCR